MDGCVREGAVMIVLSGVATGYQEKAYRRQDGTEGVMRKVSVLSDNGTSIQQVTLTKDIPAPGQGEVVAYEVGCSAFLFKGRALVDFTAYRLAPLPEVAPARVAG